MGHLRYIRKRKSNFKVYVMLRPGAEISRGLLVVWVPDYVIILKTKIRNKFANLLYNYVIM